MPHNQLATLRTLLALFERQALSTQAFSEGARAQGALLAALPPRYGEVLLGLLDRLEASALFDEESCSFSQADLRANLHLWLDKAAQQLGG